MMTRVRNPVEGRKEGRNIQTFRNERGGRVTRVWWPQRLAPFTTVTTVSHHVALKPSIVRGFGGPWPDDIAETVATGIYQVTARLQGWDRE